MVRNIAIISDHASPLAALGGVDSGGQNVYVAQIATNLASLGYSVDVFTRKDSPDQPEIVEWCPGVRVIHVPSGPADFVRKEDLLPLMEGFSAYVVDFIAAGRGSYDVVHANFWMSGIVARRIKDSFAIPYVVTFHALGRVRRANLKNADLFSDHRFEAEDAVIANADCIIAECPQDEEDLRTYYPGSDGKIVMIPCGFNPEHFGPMNKRLARGKLGLRPDAPVVLHVGRMVRRKGVDSVIEALGVLHHHHDVRAKLLIVGGEEELPGQARTPELLYLKEIALRSGVGPFVEFIGRRSHEVLKYFYNAADVFVTTPWYEPFGLTVVEAMACGTPVVGSDVGGIKYTVLDGKTGYLVPPRNPEAIADRLATLLNNPDLLIEFKLQSVSRAVRHFNWRKVACDIASLYEQTARMGLSTAKGNYPGLPLGQTGTPIAV